MSFDTGIRITDTPTITIDYDIYKKIEALSNAMGSTEWIGYLIGDGLTITDIFIPEQEVSGAAADVTNVQEDIGGVIGTVHSHHNMGSFLSQTDKDYICTTYPLTLVYSNQDKIKAWATVTLQDTVQKCLIELAVAYDIPENAAASEWVQNVLPLIKKREVAATKPYSTYRTKPGYYTTLHEKNKKIHEDVDDAADDGIYIACKHCNELCESTELADGVCIDCVYYAEGICISCGEYKGQIHLDIEGLCTQCLADYKGALYE